VQVQRAVGYVVEVMLNGSVLNEKDGLLSARRAGHSMELFLGYALKAYAINLE
jgi:hypothetical protein